MKKRSPKHEPWILIACWPIYVPDCLEREKCSATTVFEHRAERLKALMADGYGGTTNSSITVERNARGLPQTLSHV